MAKAELLNKLKDQPEMLEIGLGEEEIDHELAQKKVTFLACLRSFQHLLKCGQRLTCLLPSPEYLGAFLYLQYRNQIASLGFSQMQLQSLFDLVNSSNNNIVTIIIIITTVLLKS